MEHWMSTLLQLNKEKGMSVMKEKPFQEPKGHLSLENHVTSDKIKLDGIGFLTFLRIFTVVTLWIF